MTHTVTEADVTAFAKLTGDFNPVHIDEEFAAGTIFKTRIAHGAFVASLLSAVMGTKMPGWGAIFRSLNLSYRGPVRIGDDVLVHCEVAEIDLDKQLVTISCWCKVDGKKVVRGDAGAWVARRVETAG
jgi:3-hydroxybutyryl-CoA dehydratase